TLGVFALGFTFDQVIKLSALSALADGTAIELLPSVSFRLAFNPGVAFSLGASYGAVTGLFVLTLLTALTVWIGTKITRRHRPLELAILALVAARSGRAAHPLLVKKAFDHVQSLREAVAGRPFDQDACDLARSRNWVQVSSSDLTASLARSSVSIRA
ncbi:MAG: signal peptidase II, partial [Mycetocola sp.]